MNELSLSNGVRIPQLGYGVYQIAKEDCARCVLDALKTGYRHIDTAQAYYNEEEVGTAIVESGIPREEIFLTSKVWIENYGYENAKRSVEESLRKLQTDYIDLMLLHQPFGDYYGAWRALEELYRAGKLRAIGVSNFYPDRLVDLCAFSSVRPMVNQVETHPFNQQTDAQKWMENTASGSKGGRRLAKDEEICFINPSSRKSGRNTENGGADDPALEYATADHRHTEIDAYRADEREFRHFRF